MGLKSTHFLGFPSWVRVKLECKSSQVPTEISKLIKNNPCFNTWEDSTDLYFFFPESWRDELHTTRPHSLKQFKKRTRCAQKITQTGSFLTNQVSVLQKPRVIWFLEHVGKGTGELSSRALRTLKRLPTKALQESVPMWGRCDRVTAV